MDILLIAVASILGFINLCMGATLLKDTTNKNVKYFGLIVYSTTAIYIFSTLRFYWGG